MALPHFTIKNRFQKRAETYQEILSYSILEDLCQSITGQKNYTIEFDESGYNKGRLATLEYDGYIAYISLSEFQIGSRNSFFQSFPSALVKFYQEPNPNKAIFFYFLPPNGPIETAYFKFMYRLMKTAGTVFINADHYLANPIVAFSSPLDIILQRDANRIKNKGNASSYITFDDDGTLQIFGKTYGANKYETTLLALALKQITLGKMELYEIQENDLRRLPADSRAVIIAQGIEVFTSDLRLEREAFEKNDSLRSPTYLYNLLEKLGEKKCAFCDCTIPQIIHGAHIWPVANIKQRNELSFEEKLSFAVNGDNGIWLCSNHHKLFDMNFLVISDDGRLKYKAGMQETHEQFLKLATSKTVIETCFMNVGLRDFLEKRNLELDEDTYLYV